MPFGVEVGLAAGGRTRNSLSLLLTLVGVLKPSASGMMEPDVEAVIERPALLTFFFLLGDVVIDATVAGKSGRTSASLATAAPSCSAVPPDRFAPSVVMVAVCVLGGALSSSFAFGLILFAPYKTK